MGNSALLNATTTAFFSLLRAIQVNAIATGMIGSSLILRNMGNVAMVIWQFIKSPLTQDDGTESRAQEFVVLCSDVALHSVAPVDVTNKIMRTFLNTCGVDKEQFNEYWYRYRNWTDLSMSRHPKLRAPVPAKVLSLIDIDWYESHAGYQEILNLNYLLSGMWNHEELWSKDHFHTERYNALASLVEEAGLSLKDIFILGASGYWGHVMWNKDNVFYADNAKVKVLSEIMVYLLVNSTKSIVPEIDLEELSALLDANPEYYDLPVAITANLVVDTHKMLAMKELSTFTLSAFDSVKFLSRSV